MQQAQPVMMVSAGWIVLIVLVLAAIGGFLAIHKLFGKTGLAVAGLLGLVSLVGLFVLMFVGLTFVKRDEAYVSYPATVSVAQPVQGDPDSTTAITPKIPAPPEPATPIGPTPSKIQYITGSSAPIEIAELPTWRKNPVHEGSPESGIAKYVLTSQQFATVDEAEAKLYASLATDVQHALIQSRSPASGWVPTPEDLQVSGLITEKVIETIPLKVGEFETPVVRVSWLVEFNPQTSQALHRRWEPSESQRRSKLILTIMASVSALFGVSAMALRRSRNQAALRPPENQLA